MKEIFIKFPTGVGEITNNGNINNDPTEWKFKGNEVEVSDGYHTMDELYDHRLALSVALLNVLSDSNPTTNNRDYIECRKSLFHHDGTMFEGYFIVFAKTQEGMISYHYKIMYWNLFNIPVLEKAPEYDGHTSQDVIERLLKL